jgi:hypothetical protein
MIGTKAITKWLLGAALGSAFLLGVPNKAQAAEIVVVGNPAPVAVAYYPGYGWRRREYFDHQRWEAARWRHDRWERERFHDRRFDRRY